MQTLIAFSLRVRATPLLDHPPPERWLSGEVPALGHGDCCDDGPSTAAHMRSKVTRDIPTTPAPRISELEVWPKSPPELFA
jgi:hypothetical protein